MSRDNVQLYQAQCTCRGGLYSTLQLIFCDVVYINCCLKQKINIFCIEYAQNRGKVILIMVFNNGICQFCILIDLRCHEQQATEMSHPLDLLAKQLMDIWSDLRAFAIGLIRSNDLHVPLPFLNFSTSVIHNIQDDISVFLKYDRLNMFETCMGNIKYE